MASASPSYSRLEERWRQGGVVVLDGGIGSELERLGFPSERNTDETWGTRALYEAPELTQAVHRRYVEAGADVVTTNTWRIHRMPAAEAAGLVDAPAGSWREKARLAVSLARAAVREGSDARAVAFSLCTEDVEPPLLRELAEIISEERPDLILVETVRSIPGDLRFPQYEVLLETGLPVWVSYRRCREGICGVHGERLTSDGDLFGRAAEKLEAMGISAVLINCLPRPSVWGALPMLRQFTELPLGVYPNVGRYLSPGWQFDETTTPEAYVADALRWRDEEGAGIIGGCCGVTPEHIAAVVKAL